MKLTVAVLAMLAVTLSAAPVMASVADSTGTNGGYEAHHRHHHHHTHRKHHHFTQGASDATSASLSAIV
jgi:hypothetical protein